MKDLRNDAEVALLVALEGVGEGELELVREGRGRGVVRAGRVSVLAHSRSHRARVDEPLERFAQQDHGVVRRAQGSPAQGYAEDDVPLRGVHESEGGYNVRVGVGHVYMGLGLEGRSEGEERMELEGLRW